ncbi:hypothetical protein HMPREF3188_00877 [Tissierellia bacterium KA00581]|jgi:hypothetical protein|nr:hypothetical protein HMPREF3188_00877 [Tissierellia bacterium KA00581]
MLEKFFGSKKYFIKTLFYVLVGNLMCSFAVIKFLIPAKLITGGVGGIGLMIEYVFKVPAGISIFLINVPMTLIGFYFLNKRFMTYAFISIFLYSFTLMIIRKIPINFDISEHILYSIFGGFINGVGMGFLFNHGACQGGLDIFAAIFKTKFDKNIGSTLMFVNAIIVAISSMLFGVERALLTIASMYVAYKMLDKIQMGFGNTKQLMIVTSNQREVTDRILSDLNRGVTLLHAEGAFTHKQQNVVFCIVNTKQVINVKKILNEVDPKAFLIITDAYEVKGRGFKTHEI